MLILLAMLIFHIKRQGIRIAISVHIGINQGRETIALVISHGRTYCKSIISRCKRYQHQFMFQVFIAVPVAFPRVYENETVPPLPKVTAASSTNAQKLEPQGVLVNILTWLKSVVILALL